MAHPGTFAAPYRSNLRKPGFTPLSRASSLWNITLAIGLASKPGQDQFPSILVRLGVNPHPPCKASGRTLLASFFFLEHRDADRGWRAATPALLAERARDGAEASVCIANACRGFFFMEHHKTGRC
jgi:hypothetical protein